MSLQWGRQQTYYPGAQPLSTGELAVANHKLADAINSHLLGKTGKSSTNAKSSSASELCNTPAEKMAEKVAKSSSSILYSPFVSFYVRYNSRDGNNTIMIHISHFRY